MELLIRWQNVSPLSHVTPILTAPIQATLRREGRDDHVEISVLFCDDPVIQGLNAAHRGLDKPTDVLSFAQEDPYLLGDLVISLDTAARQAAAAEWPLESELALLATHGLLHLLGYDDETAADASRMRDLAAAALIEAGIALPDETSHPFFARFEDDC